MSDTVRVKVINNTSNIYKFVLSLDGTVVNHTNITAAQLRTKLGATIADSEVDASDWDFSNPTFITVKLGRTDTVAGNYRCILIVKNDINTDGVAWDDTEVQITILP